MQKNTHTKLKNFSKMSHSKNSNNSSSADMPYTSFNTRLSLVPNRDSNLKTTAQVLVATVKCLSETFDDKWFPISVVNQTAVDVNGVRRHAKNLTLAFSSGWSHKKIQNTDLKTKKLHKIAGVPVLNVSEASNMMSDEDENGFAEYVEGETILYCKVETDSGPVSYVRFVNNSEEAQVLGVPSSQNIMGAYCPWRVDSILQRHLEVNTFPWVVPADDPDFGKEEFQYRVDPRVLEDYQWRLDKFNVPGTTRGYINERIDGTFVEPELPPPVSKSPRKRKSKKRKAREVDLTCLSNSELNELAKMIPAEKKRRRTNLKEKLAKLDEERAKIAASIALAAQAADGLYDHDDDDDDEDMVDSPVMTMD